MVANLPLVINSVSKPNICFKVFSYNLLLLKETTEHGEPKHKKAKLEAEDKEKSQQANEVAKRVKDEEKNKNKEEAERKKKEKLQKIAEKK